MIGRPRRWLSLLGGLALLVAALPAHGQLWPGFTPDLPVYVIGRFHNAMAMVEYLQAQGIAAETYAASSYVWGSGQTLLTGTSAANTAGAATISAGNVGWMQAAAGEALSGSAQIIVVGEGIGPITITEAAIATQAGAEITSVAVPGSAIAVEATAAEAQAAVSAVGAIAGTTVAPVVVGAVVVAGTVIIAVEVGAIVYYCHQAGGLTQCFVDPSSPPSPVPSGPGGSTSADAGTSSGGSSGGTADGGYSPSGGTADAGHSGSGGDGGSYGGGSPTGGGTQDAGTVGLYGYCGCSWSSLYCGGSCQPGLYCDWTGTCVQQGS
jgi:hypothetical protein